MLEYEVLEGLIDLTRNKALIWVRDSEEATYYGELDSGEHKYVIRKRRGSPDFPPYELEILVAPGRSKLFEGNGVRELFDLVEMVEILAPLEAELAELQVGPDYE